VIIGASTTQLAGLMLPPGGEWPAISEAFQPDSIHNVRRKRDLSRIIRHLQWRRASDTKLKADAPHCNSGYPSRGPAVNHRIIKARYGRLGGGV